MGTKMVSLRVDEELLGWATGYAKERGTSRTSVVEAALRSFRGDCEGGVPELEDGRVPREVAPYPMAEGAKRPVPPPSVVPPVKRPARSSQSALAMARMRRMNPNRYGGGL